MSAVVADTHAIIWYLASSSRLSAVARTAMNAASEILLSSISLVEIVYLVEKGRLPTSALGDLDAELNRASTTLRVVPLDRDVARAVALVTRADVPDLPDRNRSHSVASERTHCLARSKDQTL